MSHSFVNILPRELLLRIISSLDFSDLWSLAHTTRSCQKLVHQVLWRKHRLDLARIDPFEHLIHSAMAHVCRNGTNSLELVASHLAITIYDSTPQLHWEASLHHLLDKSLRIMLDHVVYDKERDSTDERISRMGQLTSNLLTIFYPAIIDLFDTRIVRDTYHRLLLSHIDRHIHLLIRKKSPQIQQQRQQQQKQRRDSLRDFVRFIGTLVQNELVTVTDLQVLAQQRIAHLKQPLSSIHQEQWIEEAELRTMALLDLLRAVVCRQNDRWDSGREMHKFACLVNQTVSTLVSLKTAMTATTQS